MEPGVREDTFGVARTPQKKCRIKMMSTLRAEFFPLYKLRNVRDFPSLSSTR